jgi:hypothetical protein
MKKENLILLISVVAGILSILAICMSVDAFSLSETAYLGWIVAVLSTLIVVLIGWQIHTIIDTKSEIRDFDNRFGDLTERINHALNRNKAELYISLSEFYRNDGRLVYECFNYSLLAVQSYMIVRELAICNTLIRVLIESFPVTGEITTNKKALLLQVAAEIKSGGGSSLIGFDTLHSLIITKIRCRD